MIIERNGVQLIRLTEADIEFVRQKRNLPEIQNTMEYRDHITPEMQQKWFTSIDNINNYYLLISVNGIRIGLISATDINWDEAIINNGGVFIWDVNYLESAEILNASLLITDAGFCMGIKKNYIKILSTNKRSIAYNKSMGYELLPGQELISNQKYELRWDRYFTMTDRVRKLLKAESRIKMIVSPGEYEWHRVSQRLHAGAGSNDIDLGIDVFISRG